MCDVLVVLACLAACWPAAGAAAAPHTQVAGGRTLEAPSEAPWSVLTNQRDGPLFAQCSGSIVDATHVLTAAHCAFEESGDPFPLTGYRVFAGLAHPGPNDEAQARKVSAIRIGPSYKPLGGGGADVAVLTLDAPLDFSGPGVGPIAVAPVGSPLPPGSLARIVGWGQVREGVGDGSEHELTQAVLRQRTCLGGEASMLCAASALGGTCHGDSGAGLAAGSPPLLVGVLSVGVGLPQCTAGARTGYVSVASPEVGLWLAGSSEPPPAPSAALSAGLRGVFVVGAQVSCLAPPWQNATTVSSVFFRADSGEDLQLGPSTYSPTAADAGHPLACASIAQSVGGLTESAPSGSAVVATARTPSTSPAASAPPVSYGRSRDLVRVTSKRYRHGRWRVELRAGALLGRPVAVKWRARGCGLGCRFFTHLRLRRQTVFHSPLLPRRRQARLVVKLPSVTIGSTHYARSRLVVRP